MGFIGPIERCSPGPFLGLFGGDFFVQVVGIFLVLGFAFLLEEDGAVPDGMEIGGAGAVEKKDESAVAAFVAVALGAVKGLVEVADEVNDEFQGFDAPGFWSGGVGEGHLVDFGCFDDVVAIFAVAFFVEASGVGGDVDVVPGAGFGETVADCVGPACDVGV